MKTRTNIMIFSLIIIAILLLFSCGNEEKNILEKSEFENLITSDKDVVIVAHKAPTGELANDQQYEYLKQANVDIIEWETNPYHITEEAIKKTLDLCEKHDIGIIICDEEYKNLHLMEDSAIKAAFERYKNYDCVVGYHIIDEPSYANQYAQAIRMTQEVDPGSIAQLNFFPIGAIPDLMEQAEDLLSIVGDDLRYLSYDQYPFAVTPGSVPQMFNNMDEFRVLGLKYDIDTALYIQSIGLLGGYRKPTIAETRYHMSAALAYGYKNLKFYTWCTTPYNPHLYTDGIIAKDGTPSDTFEGICEINADIKKVSRVLANLDAFEIYHNGRRDTSAVELTDDWYVRATDKSDFLVSLMVDRTTNRNYLMFVNKDFQKDVTLKVELHNINSIQEITSGDITNADLTGNVLSVSMKAGGFALFVLGENDDLRSEPVYDVDTSANPNYALGKPIHASNSVGKNGVYASKLLDGKTGYDVSNKGWRAESSAEDGKANQEWVMVDLLRSVTIKQIRIAPYYHTAKQIAFAPKNFTIQCSDDGNTWNDVLRVTDFTFDSKGLNDFNFEPVQCRYVRVIFTDLEPVSSSSGNRYVVALSELEIR